MEWFISVRMGMVIRIQVLAICRSTTNRYCQRTLQSTSYETSYSTLVLKKGQKYQVIGCIGDFPHSIPSGTHCPMHLNLFRLIVNSHVNWQRISVNTAARTIPFCQPQMASSLTDILSVGSCYMWFPRL